MSFHGCNCLKNVQIHNKKNTISFVWKNCLNLFGNPIFFYLRMKFHNFTVLKNRQLALLSGALIERIRNITPGGTQPLRWTHQCMNISGKSKGRRKLFATQWACDGKRVGFLTGFQACQPSNRCWELKYNFIFWGMIKMAFQWHRKSVCFFDNLTGKEARILAAIKTLLEKLEKMLRSFSKV